MGRGNNRPQVRATTLQRNNVLKIKMLKKQRLTTATALMEKDREGAEETAVEAS